MGQPDQCPSKGEFEMQPRKFAPEQVGVSPTGKAYWRSMEDLADAPEFRDWLEREFPSGASELFEGSRRTFLKLMGASMALAGAAALPGCRRPDHKIMPYSRHVPEDTIPGRPTYFATSVHLAAGTVEGLLVETHENRPTKIEGNPLHPVNLGRSSAWAQACVLGLYDPDRLKDPVFTDAGTDPRSWDDFAVWSAQHFAQYDAGRGRGLAFIVDKKRSPTLRAMRERILQRWPEAVWVWYDALQPMEAQRGSRIAFGSTHHTLLHLDRARVIVSLDADFLHCEGRGLVHNREFASTRRVLSATDEMSRLYVIESGFSGPGAKSDHRLSLPPSQVSAFAMALHRAVTGGGGGGEVPAEWRTWIEAIAEDLRAAGGRGLIVAGPTQPAAVHAAVHAMNAAIGAVGTTVSYAPMDEQEASSSADAMAGLARAIDGTAITTLVTLNANPVYNAPAELNFAERFGRVPMRITLSVDLNETVAASKWQLAGAHDLEAWGDTQTEDGVIAPVQPMIAPLYAGRSDIEVLAIIAGSSLQEADGYKLVRETWRGLAGGGDFERTWRRALHDGVMPGSQPRTATPRIRGGEVSQAVSQLRVPPAPTAQGLEVVFARSLMGDGRWNNNPWIQELPDPATKIVWDNAAIVSPATAQALGLMPDRETAKERHARMADLTVGDRTMQIPVWILPGVADNTVLLPLGYGRRVVGRVGEGTGFNTFLVRGSEAPETAGGARLAATAAAGVRRSYPISTTQMHGSMEGRAIVREVDVQAWARHAGEPPLEERDAYGRTRTLSFAERLEGAELSHMPANVSIYRNPFNQSTTEAVEGSQYAKPPQWGMSIDLSACTGCGVCTIACQAENNIPVVGKIEVNKGREMQWIRVDRYFHGDSAHTDSMLFQPVPCMHCENAPCETVCPVNATVHGPSGLNYMAYNRCIGTRYCANNCPYKVRRFNFFDYAPTRFNGDYLGKETIGGIVQNPNLVPPRLRERLDEISRMQRNPNVTVRSRGVMEKCSYCIQRINEVRIETKLADLDGIADGAVQTACQQACPSDAIVFGDLLDQKGRDGQGSMVRRMATNQRTYMLLGYLNTRPRTTYMIGVRNPNPRLRAPNEHPFGHGHGGHQSGHEGHGHQDDHHHTAPAGQGGAPHGLLTPADPADTGLKVRLNVLGALA